MVLHQCLCEGFLVGGMYACVVYGAGSLSLKGSAMSRSAFWVVYGLGMTLSSLSDNGQVVLLFC